MTFGQFRNITAVERMQRGLEHVQQSGALVARTAVVVC